MQRRIIPFLIATTALALQPVAAFAYIGPGVGAGAIAAVLGVLGSLLLAIVAVIYYPIKRMLKGGKGRAGKAASGDRKPR
jgi:hypothetical protein